MNKKKRTCHQVDFAVIANNRWKLRENEKYYGTLKVTVILMVVGPLGSLSKNLKKKTGEAGD